MAVLLLALSSCSKKIYFNTSSVVPAAVGYAKIKKDKNGNFAIDISISNLAEVERLEGHKKVYVVWMNSSHENPKNLGQINSDTKGFSRKLMASFHTVSSIEPSKLYITAEEDGGVQYPGNYEVLTTESL